MIKAGQGVEFRGAWRDAIKKYYAFNKNAGYNGEISDISDGSDSDDEIETNDSNLMCTVCLQRRQTVGNAARR